MARTSARGLLRGVRPHQWSKNALVFAAPIAAGVITEPEVALRAFGAFVAFCLAAGGTYLLNDARDVEEDRRHPTKRQRPIAAGEVAVADAYVVGVLLIAAAIALGWVIAGALAATLAAYLVLTTCYSFWLKHIAIVDLVAVSSGFVLRAVAGAAAVDIPFSEWFFVVTSAGALMMITGKREAELAESGPDGGTRPVLSQYTPAFLASVRTVAAGLALIAYCLWSFDPSVATEGNAVLFLRISVAPFTIAILRYALLIEHGRGAEPERLLFEDRVLLVAGAMWAMIYAYGVYLA